MDESLTPLHTAALLEDANVDEDYDTLPRLHLAAYCGEINIIKYLILERHASVSSENVLGSTPLQFACLQGEVETAKLLIELGSDLYHLDHRGIGCLMSAVLYKQADIVRLLIKHNMNVAGTGGLQAREYALKVGFHEIVEILQQEELALSKSTAFAMSHHLRLGDQSTAKVLDPEVMRMILREVINYVPDVMTHTGNVSNGSEMTPLHAAALEEHFDVDVQFEKPPRLHQAAIRGELNIIRYLILEVKLKLSGEDERGNTALDRACMSGSAEAVELLLELGADMSHIDYDTDNCLQLAVEFQKADIVRLLIKHKVNVLDESWTRVREVAVQRNFHEILAIMEEAERTLEISTAFAMSHHERLGVGSMAEKLDPEVLRRIIERVCKL